MASMKTVTEEEMYWRVDPTVMNHDLGGLDSERDRMGDKYQAALKEEREQDELWEKEKEELKIKNKKDLDKMEQELADVDQVIAAQRSCSSMDFDDQEPKSEEQKWVTVNEAKTSTMK